MYYPQNPNHHLHHIPTKKPQPDQHHNKSPPPTSADAIVHQLASCSDDIIGFDDKNHAVGNGSVDFGLVTNSRGGLGDSLVGVTTWFHAGASGKASSAAASVVASSSSTQPRGY